MARLAPGRGQASVLTVVIMIVMVVFSIYAMTEYALIIDSPIVTAPTSATEIFGSTVYNYTITTTQAITDGSRCLPGQICSSQLKTSFTSESETKTDDPGDAVQSGVVACPMVASGKVVLTALDSSTGMPLSGLGVQASDTLTSCAGVRSTIQLGHSITNGSGMVTLCCNAGSYNISLDYGGAAYFAIANVSAAGSACVSLYLPLGKVSVSYSATVTGYCNSENS